MNIIDIKGLSVLFGAPKQYKCDYETATKEDFLKQGIISGVINANLSVHEGEILVLMGLSGSGKTSLLRVINGLNAITDGSCMIHHNGVDYELAGIADDKLRHIRRNVISMVFQHYGLLPWRSVLDNVAFGMEISGIDEKTRHERAENILKMVGLEKFMAKKIQELSGGMQQRVGIARALVTQSPILLMDEPFSALDPIIRYNLQGELLETQAKLARTIVFVSHDLDEAVRIGTRIAIMHQGKIVQIGKPEEILLTPANDYVKEFVSHINPLNVITAGSLLAMQEKQPTFHTDNPTAHQSTRVQELLKIFVATNKNITITDNNNQPIGTIHSPEMLPLILGAK